jgi:hypothetical protein
VHPSRERRSDDPCRVTLNRTQERVKEDRPGKATGIQRRSLSRWLNGAGTDAPVGLVSRAART